MKSQMIEALELCQKALSMMITPAQIDQTSTLQAFAIATEAEAKARAALSVQPAAAVVGEPAWWIVTTDMGKVIFHGPDKERADRVAAIHSREAQPLYAATCDDTAIRAHLHLIRCFADEINERNWADKALYIKQQAERVMTEIDAAPSAPDGWQNIETAPKDGTKILAWSGFWDKHHLIRWNQGENAWCEGSWCFGSVPDMVWMPLPAPPEALGGKP